MLPSVYQNLGFINVVGLAMERSMVAAVDEVKANKGEVRVCECVEYSVLLT